MIRNIAAMFLVLLLSGNIAGAQSRADSAGAARSLTELLQYCDPVFLADSVDAFPVAARHIIYRGGDKQRRWKSFCNMNQPDELQYVQQVCGRIYNILAQRPLWTITQYHTQHESEGQWHALKVIFKNKKGEEEIFLFAFLKVDGCYGLGDIDVVRAE